MPVSQQLPLEPGIVWGVKTSFCSYVSNLPDGEILVAEGSSERTDGTFHFPFEALESNEDNTELHIRGSGRITLSGHGGMMVVPIAQPTVLIAPEGAGLFVEQDNGTTLQLAVLKLGALEQLGNQNGWSEVPVELTASGSAFFGGLYQEGTEMSPLTIVLPANQSE